ncbi:hypothetical protein V8E54_001316 [Elaphomyces granulatus]
MSPLGGFWNPDRIWRTEVISRVPSTQAFASLYDHPTTLTFDIIAISISRIFSYQLGYKLQETQIETNSLELARRLLDTPGWQRDIWSNFYLESIYFRQAPARDWTGLVLARFLGLTDVVDDILMQGCSDINAGGACVYDNALHAACDRGHRETVKLLLSKNADVNAQGGRYGCKQHLAKVIER